MGGSKPIATPPTACDNETVTDPVPHVVPENPLYRAMIAGGVDYRPWEGQGLDDDQCFVCGLLLTPDTKTREDVFPRWLQRDLTTRKRHPKIVLPNATTIGLGKILIPACSDCNGSHLSKIESEVFAAFKLGPTYVDALPERTVRTWLAKIAYGLRRNDLRLKQDQRDPNSATIAVKRDVEQLKRLHLLLQEVRDVVYVPDGHSTFFVFESQEVNCGICDFDTAFPIGWPHPAMLRLGTTTILGAIDDQGTLEVLRSHPAFVAAQSLRLHPMQVRALLAILIHTAYTLRPDVRGLRFGVSEGRLWVHRQTPPADLFDTARVKASADAILRNLIDMPEDELSEFGGAVGMLVGRDGKPREMLATHNV